MHRHVIILGAGPAGLSAAWKLSEAGVDIQVIEAESQVGGLCRTIRKHGAYFDLGGHRFITKDKEVQRELELLMQDELLVRPRKSMIRLKGEYFRYPLDIKDVVWKLPPWFTTQAFVDYVLTMLLQKLFPRPDSSFENWVINRFGTVLYHLYFEPYSRKLWGIPPNTISAAWAEQRISLLNLADVFWRMLGKKKEEPKTYARQFYYPQHGIGQIPETMAEKILQNGGKIHLNSRVTQISVQDTRITGIVAEHNGQEQIFSGDYYINTLPLPDVVRMLVPKVEEPYHILADKMDFRSIRFVNLLVNKEQVTDNTWIYIPEEQYLFFRIQEMRNWSPTTVPEGKTALILEIACNVGDSVWNANDAEITTRCIHDLEALGLLKAEDVDEYFTIRVEHGYPVYTLDYSRKVDRILRIIKAFPYFLSIGRQGLYRYNNMDHSIKMGFLSARHLLEGLPVSEILHIATEREIFDWQDPGK